MGIMSVELQKAFESDMAVIREDNKPEYVDNVLMTLCPGKSK